MVALNEATLLRALDAFEHGATYLQAAEAIGVSRRFLFRWAERSRVHDKGFFLIYKGVPGYWHNFVERIRMEHVYLTLSEFDGMSDEEVEALTGSRNRFVLDKNGNRIRRPEEQPPDMSDIEELQAAARERPKHPTPDSPVHINRVSHSGDPVEQITGQQPERSTAERERAHPRAYQDPNADLRPPVWAKPKSIPIEGAGLGHQGPPDTMRMTVATQTYSYNERVPHGPMSLRDAKGNPIK
jgi:hypothetical protein